MKPFNDKTIREQLTHVRCTFDAGARAFRHGVEACACPYPSDAGTYTLRAAWLGGWYAEAQDSGAKIRLGTEKHPAK